MSRYYQRSYYRGYYRDHRSERSRLSHQFAGIDREIEKIFLNLETSSLDKLLQRYGKQYGERPESYARKTYPKWKSGEVKLSGQTAQRLLELLPPLLPAEKRYDLVKRLREQHITRSSVCVNASIEDWRERISDEVNKMVEKRRAFDFDESLKEKATWLTSGDTQNANKILNAIDEEEARIRASYLEEEFQQIQHFIDTVENTENITHRLQIPHGEVIVNITLENNKKHASGLKKLFFNGQQAMKQNKKDLIPKEKQDLELTQRENPNLLDSTLAQIDDSEKTAIRKKLVEEKIKIDVSQKKADQRHYDSTRDLTNTIKTVQGLEGTTKSDYDIRQTSETASGRIDVQVKKSNSNTLIIVVIVVGIIALVLASL